MYTWSLQDFLATMDGNRIYRTTALQRMSSPEQLDRLMRVTSPRTWLALLSLVLLLMGLVAWGYWGEVATKVRGEGVLVRAKAVRPQTSPTASIPPLHAALEAVVYVPSELAYEIRVGMDAEVLPAAARREEHGFVRGSVASVSDVIAPEVAPAAGSVDTSPNRGLTDGPGPVVEVRVAMQRDSSTASGYHWSSPSGASVRISRGTRCTAEIITRRQRPLSMVVPGIDAAR